jgi:hypothetical protein
MRRIGVDTMEMVEPIASSISWIWWVSWTQWPGKSQPVKRLVTRSGEHVDSVAVSGGKAKSFMFIHWVGSRSCTCTAWHGTAISLPTRDPAKSRAAKGSMSWAGRFPIDQVEATNTTPKGRSREVSCIEMSTMEAFARRACVS